MRKAVGTLTLMLLAAAGGIFGWQRWTGQGSLRQLMGENKELKQALANLNETEQVGYAKVLRQERRDRTLYTQLLLVQTDPQDPAKHLSEQVFEVAGDVVHFDALVVKFAPSLIESGKQRALFIWRRVYGEYQSPSDGFPVTQVGEVPARYAKLMDRLGPSNEAMFWQSIWELAHDTDALAQFGITATYGNAVYTQLRPGLIYAFKANSSGQVWPEIYPAL